MSRVQDYNEVQAKERQRTGTGGAGRRGGDTRNASPGTGGSILEKDRSKESAKQTAKEIGVAHTTVTKAKSEGDKVPPVPAETMRRNGTARNMAGDRR
jgi:hypothetical protein